MAVLSPDRTAAEPFVARGSIVRQIWGDADVMLLIFAASAAEFALNRAVDWVFFTGMIPRDPIGRFVATARHARAIVFATRAHAARTLAHIHEVHVAVERQRGERIPAWAYRDVLYMLVDYSERAYTFLYRALTPEEREELYDVFRRVGESLGVQQLPGSYAEWREDRARHLERDLVVGPYTAELLEAYRRELGEVRYALLQTVQRALVPDAVLSWLGRRRVRWVRYGVPIYALAKRCGLRSVIMRVAVPATHLRTVKELDTPASG